MPRGKKKTETPKVSETSAKKTVTKAVTAKKTHSTKAKAKAAAVEQPKKETAAKVESKTATKKPRTTKAKTAPTAAKSANKTTKKVTKKEEVQTAAPKVEVKIEEKIAKKSAAPVKKRTPRKSAKGAVNQVVLQGNSEYSFDEITELCKKAYRNGTKKQIKSIKIYIKAENNMLKAYYVVNDSVNGSVEI